MSTTAEKLVKGLTNKRKAIYLDSPPADHPSDKQLPVLKEAMDAPVSKKKRGVLSSISLTEIEAIISTSEQDVLKLSSNDKAAIATLEKGDEYAKLLRSIEYSETVKKIAFYLFAMGFSMIECNRFLYHQATISNSKIPRSKIMITNLFKMMLDTYRKLAELVPGLELYEVAKIATSKSNPEKKLRLLEQDQGQIFKKYPINLVINFFIDFSHSVNFESFSQKFFLSKNTSYLLLKGSDYLADKRKSSRSETIQEEPHPEALPSSLPPLPVSLSLGPADTGSSFIDYEIAIMDEEKKVRGLSSWQKKTLSSFVAGSNCYETIKKMDGNEVEREIAFYFFCLGCSIQECKQFLCQVSLENKFLLRDKESIKMFFKLFLDVCQQLQTSSPSVEAYHVAKILSTRKNPRNILLLLQENGASALKKYAIDEIVDFFIRSRNENGFKTLKQNFIHLIEQKDKPVDNVVNVTDIETKPDVPGTEPVNLFV